MTDNDQDNPATPQTPFVPQQWFEPTRLPQQGVFETGGSLVTPPSGGAMINIEGGAVRAVGGQFEITRAPFSEAAIAESLARDPEFYRQLMQMAAATLRRDAENYPVPVGQGNSAAIIKAELIATAEKFENAVLVLDSHAPDRFATAAKAVVEIRDQIVGFAKNHPALTKGFFQLSGVIFGTFALCQIGVPVTLSALIAAAVVQDEKLSKVIAACRGQTNEDDQD
jgi:hypothetical protein